MSRPKASSTGVIQIFREVRQSFPPFATLKVLITVDVDGLMDQVVWDAVRSADGRANVAGGAIRAQVTERKLPR